MAQQNVSIAAFGVARPRFCGGRISASTTPSGRAFTAERRLRKRVSSAISDPRTELRHRVVQLSVFPAANG